jgi:peptidyl-prolyl cis-trans isomerase D
MLRGLRKASENWLGRIVLAGVMGLLVVSFAIWGINDIFRGFGRSTFAKIGRTEISIDQFRDLYRDRLQQLSRQLGRNITLDQARAAGLDRQIVSQIVGDFVVDERARQLGLAASDSEISRRITSEPSFQDPNGQFDRQRFEYVLRQAGFTEGRFIAEQRREMVRRELAGTIVGPPFAPNAAVEAADRYQNEQRTIEYVLLDRAQAGEIPTPAPEMLASYFDEHKGSFRAPEYRKIVVLALTPGELAHSIEISDEDVQRAYDERKASYSAPERRDVQQIVFDNPDQAHAASERIANGEGFDAIAKERNLTEKDIDLGTVTKSAMIDQTVADAAFALKEGEVSTPVQGRFGTVLLRVVKIEPAKVPTLDEVAGQIRNDLAAERAKEQLNDLYNKVEDDLSIGKPLAEVAENLKLSSRTVEIDRAGQDASGKAVTDLPDAQRIVASAFTTEIGVENDPIQFEGGYVWYEVAGITPSRDRTLDEVKDQVETRWRDDEIASRLKAKAQDMLDKVKGGTSLADAAAAAGLKVETKSDIKRRSASSPLSAQAVDVVFRTAKDAVASAPAEQAGEQVVFRVTDIVVPKFDPDSQEAKRLRDSLNSAYADDIYGAYIASIRDKVGVTISEAGVRQVVTGQTNPVDEN